MTPARAAWLSIGAVALVITILIAALAVAGYPPGSVLSAAWRGIASSPVRLAMSLQDVGPLLLCGLAASIAFRSGVLNIGGEGQFLLGAALCVGLTTTWRPPGPGWLIVVVACLVGAAAGSLWALLAGSLERWRGVPVVLSTILLNFIAVFLVSWLVEGPWRDPATTAPQTAALGDDVRLPILVAGSSLHLGVLLAVIIGLLWWLVERRSVFGFELGVAGDNPTASAAAGIPIARRRLQALCIAGALAGLAGAFQLSGVTGFMSGTTRSFGYLGVAVALLGRLHPMGILMAAVFFSLLDGAARGVERSTGLPRDLADCAKGIVVLTVLIIAAWAARRMRRTAVMP